MADMFKRNQKKPKAPEIRYPDHNSKFIRPIIPPLKGLIITNAQLFAVK